MFRNPSIVARYAFTIVAVTVATLFRVALVPVLGEAVPFILYFPTVVLCAWFGGKWTGLTATALTGLISWFIFISPYYSFIKADWAAPVQMTIFLLAGVLISLLAESLHQAKRKSEENEGKERKQREQLRVTLTSIGDAVIATDAQGKVIFMNEVAESLTQWKQEEASGKPLEEIFHILNEQTRQPVENPALRAIKDGLIVGLANHTVLIARDGTERPIDDSGAPITSADGEMLGAVLIFRDMTERRQEEKARALFASIVESSEDAIITKSLDGIIESWNISAEQLFEFSANEAIGQPVTLIIPQERIQEEQLILEQLRQGKRIKHFETVRVSKNGRRLDISLSISPVRDAEGQIIGIAKIARDVTARKRVEQERELLLVREQEARAEAEAANRMKDEFLATVSHELRTPLNAILGWSTMLRRGSLNESLTANAIEAIERNARSQAQLIEDLLDISRIISGKLRLEIKAIEFVSVIKAAIDAVQHAAKAKEIQLQMVIDPAANHIQGDEARLQQVIWNLLSNAVKFTAKGGLVQVKLERKDSMAHITVSDTGEGINPEFLPYVFDRFQQADGTTTRRHGGLGLGLAIARHIVEMHGGTIGVHSAGLGQGANFTVRLPFVAVHTPTYPPANQPGNERHEETAISVDPAVLQGLRILTVDDESDTRDMVKAVLMQYGADVVTAASAREAFETLPKFKPDVLVSDIGMPEEDGHSLIRKIRDLEPEKGGNTPAIALTGYVRVEERMRALEAGFQMFVPKPVEALELVSIIASLVGKTEKDNENPPL
jgi:PAS domain S-box-containing protein